MSLTLLFWGYILCSAIMAVALTSLSLWLHENIDNEEQRKAESKIKRN